MDVCFWERLGDFGETTAIIDENPREEWSYKRLAEATSAGAEVLRSPEKRLVFLFANNDAGAILCYLSALKAGHVIYIGSGAASWADAADLLEKYRPDVLLWRGRDDSLPPLYHCVGEFFGYGFAKRNSAQNLPASKLSLLLSTSGSLSSPKFVRLSERNLAAAAFQVTKALGLGASHRAITSLPLNFVYGLSVVHGHLQAGASLVMTKRSVQDRAFWQLLGETGVTSLAGVPWTLRLLRSISFDSASHPRLRYFSLSGGPLEPDLLAWLQAWAKQGMSIFSMYGQTEASGRMCVLPCEEFAAKGRSVGHPVEGGSIRCDAEGNIIFTGPNVMLGYAQSWEDLTDADDLKGSLRTGDRGYLDEDGYLYITGRTSRVVKFFGMRINLDEVETFLGGAVAVACDDHSLVVFVESDIPKDVESRLQKLLQRLRVPPHSAQIKVLAKFPRTETGKVRYADLQI